MMNKNVHTFIGCDAAPDEAAIILFGAPFDGTTSFRPGTRFGPSAVRNESDGLETYSPYQKRDLEEVAVCDIGDLELPFGNVPRVLNVIQEQCTDILSRGQKPFMIGGEHLITLAAVRAAAAQFSDLHILHFDAHADLRDDYLGEVFSHATVLRRCHDLLGDGRIHQFGIRSGTRDEFDFAQAGHTDFHPFRLHGLEKTIATLAGLPVYLTVDLDVLDPAIFPGTGTPEAGGISWLELLKAILSLRQLNVVACDVNELSPHYDASGVSTAVAAKTIRELILAISPSAD